MRVCGNHLLRGATCLLLTAVPLSPLAFCQFGSSPRGRLSPLTSRSATVMLVATLESLSVSAAPAAVPASQFGDNIPPALALTTSWAIRRDCTTLRLVGYFAPDPLAQTGGRLQSLLPAKAFDPSAAGPATPFAPVTQSGSLASGIGLSLFTQRLGVASKYTSRVDKIRFAIDAANTTQPYSSRASGLLVILAEAL